MACLSPNGENPTSAVKVKRQDTCEMAEPGCWTQAKPKKITLNALERWWTQEGEWERVCDLVGSPYCPYPSKYNQTSWYMANEWSLWSPQKQAHCQGLGKMGWGLSSTPYGCGAQCCIFKRMLTTRLLCAKSFQSCLTLCDPMDCSPPGSSVHGILQARILEWVFLQGILPMQGSKQHLLCLLHWQAGSLLLMPPGKPHWKWK